MNTEILVNIPAAPRPCTCGRSATGFCTGLHRLSDQEWDDMVFDEAFKEERKNES